MRHIGRLPFTGDEYIITLRLDLTLLVWALWNAPLIGDTVEAVFHFIG